jgi:hypothetical protein
MLTHHIQPYVTRKMSQHQREHRFDGEIGGWKHKEFILKRNLKLCQWKEGQHVWYKGKRWQILAIYSEMSEGLGWDELKPQNIELWDGSSEMTWVHHGDLKTRK